MPTTSAAIRDPQYYFEDGSVVFLVDGYLFKIQRSILSSHSEVFENMFKLPNKPNPSRNTSTDGAEGTCDTNPIIIPQIKAAQFRNLLLFFYGVLTDPAYLSLAFDARDETKHNYTILERYFDIASLAHRFCMSSVEVWALDQIKLVMNSAERLSSTIQNNDSLLDILFYCKTTPNRELEENFRSLLQCYLQLPPGRWGYLGNDTQTQTWGTITLAHLYQHPTLKQQDPALFGHVFCVVLSAGRQSIIWEALTRETRLKLLAAQVYLTPLPSTLPISWISKPAEITLSLDAKTQPSCFYSCRGDFDSAIKDAFDSALYSKLSADSPLAGVTSLSKLAVYRQMIAQRFKRSAAKHTCKCRAQLLSAFDAKMNTLFTELAEKYHEHWD